MPDDREDDLGRDELRAALLDLLRLAALWESGAVARGLAETREAGERCRRKVPPTWWADRRSAREPAGGSKRRGRRAASPGGAVGGILGEEIVEGILVATRNEQGDGAWPAGG